MRNWKLFNFQFKKTAVLDTAKLQQPGQRENASDRVMMSTKRKLGIRSMGPNFKPKKSTPSKPAIR